MKALALTLALAAAALAPQAHAATVTVAIDKFAFAPADITVAPGTTVVWVNHDQAPHAIATRDHTFVSKAMDTDDHVEQRFSDTGDFSYICTLHPFMTGVVHVRPNPATAARGRPAPRR